MSAKSGVPSKIAEGGYGCVYKPRIKCGEPDLEYNASIKEKTGLNLISKVCTRKACVDEFREVNNPLLRQSDYSNKFHIGDPILCSPKNAPFDCAPANKEHKKKMLLYEDGGPSLHDYIRKGTRTQTETERRVKIIIPAFANLFEGLSIINSRGLHHNDIKPQNITVGNDPDTHPNFRFIDFGLTFILSKGSLQPNGWVEQNFNIYNTKYPAWPLDSHILIPTQYTREDNTTEAFTLSNLTSYIKRWGDFMQPFSNIVEFYRIGGFNGKVYPSYNVLYMDMALAMRKLYDESHKDAFTWYSERREIIQKIDVYSLGVALLDSVFSEIQNNTHLGYEIYKFFLESGVLQVDYTQRPDSEEFVTTYNTFVEHLQRLGLISKSASRTSSRASSRALSPIASVKSSSPVAVKSKPKSASPVKFKLPSPVKSKTKAKTPMSKSPSPSPVRKRNTKAQATELTWMPDWIPSY
jgi:serine/threonine protein kinase